MDAAIEITNPMFTGALSLVAGDLVGMFTNKLMDIYSKWNWNFVDGKAPTSEQSSAFKSAVALLLNVGLLSLGTELMARSLPWLTKDMAGFTLFMFGVWSSSSNLSHNLSNINEFFLKEFADIQKTVEPGVPVAPASGTTPKSS